MVIVVDSMECQLDILIGRIKYPSNAACMRHRN